jgi:hypothetical protein
MLNLKNGNLLDPSYWISNSNNSILFILLLNTHTEEELISIRQFLLFKEKLSLQFDFFISLYVNYNLIIIYFYANHNLMRPFKKLILKEVITNFTRKIFT